VFSEPAQIPVGAGWLAIAADQSMKMLDDKPLSPASRLLQGLRFNI
jgi:hypothetical protein